MCFPPRDESVVGTYNQKRACGVAQGSPEASSMPVGICPAGVVVLPFANCAYEIEPAFSSRLHRNQLVQKAVPL